MATSALPALEALLPSAEPPAPRLTSVSPTSPQPPDPEASARVARNLPEMTAKAWVLMAVVGLHVAVFAALVAQRFIVPTPNQPVVVELLSIPNAPAQPPQEAPEILLETPPVVIPPPIVEIEERPQAITAVVMESTPPPPPAANPVAAVEGLPAPAVRVPAVIPGGDLSASMIDAVPPHYPYESRRLKEQGTVLLDVQLSMSGTVERVSVRTSSGFARLDKAALEAVRRWRWSPTVRDGQPVAVRGVVEIPFTLMSRKNSR